MYIRFLLIVVLLLAACQSNTPAETTTSIITPIPTATNSPSATPQAAYLEAEMNGVSLGIWKPDGWETDTSDGLVLMEQSAPVRGYAESGMLIYVFVPPMDEFRVPADHSNFALALLKKVVKMPSHTGYDVAVSEPVRFDWDTHNAAYYLLSSGDGIRVLVLALALPDEPKVVVCNISVPASQSARIRELLPQILDGLTINGATLDGSALAALPDPLPFPRYSLASSRNDDEDAREITAISSP